MNDRFRFRAWNKEEKNMYYDAQNTYDYMTGKPIIFAESFSCLLTNDEEWVVEQCTGLKDKNGNLIYEGDIVKCDRDFSENGRKNLIRKVIFADGSFQLERAKTIGDRYYINAFHNFEIIGNIHEQAEQKDK